MNPSTAAAPTSERVSRPRPSTAALRGPVGSEVVALLVAAAVVQVAFPDRTDWAPHLVTGGAVVLLLAAVAPRRWAAWVGPLGVLVVGAMAVVGELLWSGPFDALDVAVSMAGALLVAASPARVGAAGVRSRATAVAWAVGLVAASLWWRYGLDLAAR